MLKWVSFKFTALFGLLMMAENAGVYSLCYYNHEEFKYSFHCDESDSGSWRSEVLQVVLPIHFTFPVLNTDR